MSQVTRILSAIEKGDPHAAEQLLPLVYDELRRLAAAKLAHEKPGQTLQATALVHEAYLRLMPNPGPHSEDASERPSQGEVHDWDSRRHFFAAAAEAMRRILLDRARGKRRIKRGGAWQRIRLDQIDIAVADPPEDLLALDAALEKLMQQDKLCAELVKLRFYAGLTMEEAGQALGISRRTVDRYWAFARSWLYDQLRQDDEPAAH